MGVCALWDSLFYQQWHWPSSRNIRTYFYQDVYTILIGFDLQYGPKRISGTYPSSMIHSQKNGLQKMKSDAQKCQNKLNPKGFVL